MVSLGCFVVLHNLTTFIVKQLIAFDGDKQTSARFLALFSSFLCKYWQYTGQFT